MTIQERLQDLADNLQKTAVRNRRRAHFYHFVLVSMVSLGVLASAVAGLGGIFFKLDAKVVGGIALIPGIFAVAANTLRLSERVALCHERKNGLRGLRRRLMYELPEEPTVDNIAAISEAWTALEDRWHKEFVKEIMVPTKGGKHGSS
jgi:hypothetical protein